MRRQWLTSGVAGLLLGLLSSSAMFVAASVLILFIPSVLIVPFLVWPFWAAWVGGKGYLPALSWGQALVALALLGPVCALAPPVLSGLELRAKAGGIPLPDGFEVLEVVPAPYGNATSGPGIVLRLAHVGGDETLFDDVAAFADRLRSEGWRQVMGSVPTARGFDISLMFTDTNYANLVFHARWNRTDHVHDEITIRHSAVIAMPLVMLGLLLVLLPTPLLLPDRRRAGVPEDGGIR